MASIHSYEAAKGKVDTDLVQSVHKAICGDANYDKDLSAQIKKGFLAGTMSMATWIACESLMSPGWASVPDKDVNALLMALCGKLVDVVIRPLHTEDVNNITFVVTDIYHTGDGKQEHVEYNFVIDIATGQFESRLVAPR